MPHYKTLKALRILSGRAMSAFDFAGLYSPEHPKRLLCALLFLGRIQKAGLIKKRNVKFELTEKGKQEIEELFTHKI